MLKTQGIIHQPIQNVIKSVNTNKRQEEQKDSTLKLMESEKFKKLLQSKNPNDVQSANLMIQNMVRENDRRIQNQNRRLMEVQRAYESSTVLNEMLDQYSVDNLSEDTVTTLREIYENCQKLKPTISRLAEETQNSEKLLNEVLKASDSLNIALEKYQNLVIHKTKIVAKPLADSNLLDVGTTSAKKENSATISSKSNNDNMDDLKDIFTSNPPNKSQNFEIDDILKPHVMDQQNNSSVPIDIKTLLQASPAKTFSQTSDFDLLKDFDLGKSNIKT